ncbi:hypothetical protein UG55_103250 [Frankia sp. EI5c]|uniref:DUF6084 family protein n=1 Tax=Frankia sp. EI5c TaxID=683316 RepID=UPI0007C3FB34|nr:DUF6084 family protein [Frankia sp. EI5c]OAA24017.1 hypothetical protein UG55_103250 [Frankia sp. EI5c]
MAELTFTCVDVAPLRHAAAPTLRFRLRIEEHSGERLHALALRCQIRINPAARRYDDEESRALTGLFGGGPPHPIQFAMVSATVPGFSGETDLDLDVPCTYDLEVAAGNYFSSLRDGVIPLNLLFSGTVFGVGAHGLRVEQVPWHLEATCRLPVACWRDLIDQYFPGTAWLRLDRGTVDALARYRLDHAIPTADAAIVALLAGETRPAEQPPPTGQARPAAQTRLAGQARLAGRPR